MTFQRVPWKNVKTRIARTWQQGQHFPIIAPTGRGKTVLIKELLPLRDHTVFFGTKVHDEEYDSLLKTGFKRIDRWPPRAWQERVMLWPRPERTIRGTKANQKLVFSEALDSLFRRGKWTVVLDELHWMAHDLGLYDEIASLHHQGRSSKLTLVSGFQRPAFVPRIVYSSATHLAVWGTNDPSDLKQLSSFTGTSVRQWQETMPTLDDYEFVYLNIRARNVPPVITQVVR